VKYQRGQNIVDTLASLDIKDKIIEELLKGCSEYFSALEMVLIDSGLDVEFRVVIESPALRQASSLARMFPAPSDSRNFIYAEIRPNKSDKYIISYLGMGSIYFFEYPEESKANQIFYCAKSASIPLLDFESIEESFYIEAFVKWVKRLFNESS